MLKIAWCKRRSFGDDRWGRYVFYFVLRSILVLQYNRKPLLKPTLGKCVTQSKKINVWKEFCMSKNKETEHFCSCKGSTLWEEEGKKCTVLMKGARVQPERTAMSLERICCQTDWTSLLHICYSCLLVCLFWFLSRPASLHRSFPSSACCHVGPQFKAPRNSFCELFACLARACHHQCWQNDI